MLEELIAKQDVYPILGHNPFNFVPIDLSSTNPELQEVDLSRTIAFEQFIIRFMNKHKATVAYGGYNEERDIYKRSSHFKNGKSSERFIHLGIDLWTTPKTPLFAPLAGKIHSMANNEGLGNYGPTIILEHQFEGVVFYTLYGHLDVSSIANKNQNQKIKRGEPFAVIGNYPNNGDYPPHLHFQVIKNIRDYSGDFPGVTSIEERELDLENCPNPMFLLKF